MAIVVELHPDAIAEARAAREWYEARSIAAAQAFVRELEIAIDAIAEAPSRWPRYQHGTQRYLMRRFPFMIVYRVTVDCALVVAVAHGRRRPGYWRVRTP